MNEKRAEEYEAEIKKCLLSELQKEIHNEIYRSLEDIICPIMLVSNLQEVIHMQRFHYISHSMGAETCKIVMPRGSSKCYYKRLLGKNEEHQEFKKFVNESFMRYIVCDWGDTCPEDSEQNDISEVP